MSAKRNEPGFFLEPIETKEARVLRRLLRYDRSNRVGLKLTTALRPEAGKRDILALASTVADTIDHNPDRIKGAAVRAGARARGRATSTAAAARRQELRSRAEEIRRQHPGWSDWRIAARIEEEIGGRLQRRTIYTHIRRRAG